ncbi:MAG: EAL domain-containing protein [Defluviitaleaceae bacterium]|nr:EAL domain-containing protein [Defluviitaleaceae bacterium]
MTGQKNKSPTLQKQIFRATMFTIIVVVLSLAASLVATGTIGKLDEIAFESVINMNAGNASLAENTLMHHSRALWGVRSNIQIKLNSLLTANNMDVSCLWENPGLIDELFNRVFDDMDRFLATNDVSGAFFILTAPSRDGAAGRYPALYLRTPNLGPYVHGRDPMALLWGYPQLNSLSGRSITVDHSWSMEFSLSGNERDDFFLMPLEAFSALPDASAANLGYWSLSKCFAQDSGQTLFYTVPISARTGEAAGVLGFELDKRHLNMLVYGGDIPFDNGFYAIGKFTGYGIDGASLTAGSAAPAAFLRNIPDILNSNPVGSSGGTLRQTTVGSQQMVFSHMPLNLTGPSSYFTNDIYMFSFADRAEVMASSRNTLNMLALALLISMTAALLASYLISRYDAGKIKKAVNIVKEMSGLTDVPSFPKTNIREIDSLLSTIEHMSADIAHQASKMSSIIDLMGLGIGVFEVSKATGMVFLTKSMYRLIDIPCPDDVWQPQFIPLRRLEAFLPQYRQAMNEGLTEMLFQVTRANGTYWLDMRLNVQEWDENTLIYGAITDVTDRVREKERLIYESTYDMLTKLLNRTSYLKKIRSYIEAEPDKAGVLAFIDLDKLKRLNDTFGHNDGDQYIMLAGKAFSVFDHIGGVAARIAGDEFVLYLHGGDSREEMRDRMVNQLERAKNRKVELADGTIVELQFSAGLAFYPYDSNDAESLVKYADFAMYEVKQSARGSIFEFDRTRYDRSGTHTNNVSYLSALLMGREVRYAFQPIVDLRTGRITSYEAIMRPAAQITYTPYEILDQAKNEGKLYELELFLFENFCKWTHYNLKRLSGYAITFNTIYDQYLIDGDFFTHLHQLGEADDNSVTIVMEVSSSRYTDTALQKRKIDRARRNGIRISMDDYSCTESEKQRVSELNPDFLKLSPEIVRGIHKDGGNSAKALEAVELARLHGAKVIAEGVETAQELCALIELGVDYGQGFYFCPPEFRLLDTLPAHIAAEILQNQIK